MNQSHAHISRFAAWFALLGGGIAWMARFLVVWAIAEFGCVSGALEIGGLRSPVVILTLVSLPFLGVAAAAVYVGWSRNRTAAADDSNLGGRFMAGTGAITSGIFIVVMIAEIVPLFYFLDECRSFSNMFSM